MKKYFYVALILTLFGLGFYIYKLTTYTYITAKFKELRPFQDSIPVYYKGIIVGKARDKKHADDYKSTLLNLVLYPKNLMLPVNTTVLLKKEKRDKKERDFLELIYPKKPSDKMLSNGLMIDGKATVDVETFLANQDPDDLEQIQNNLLESSESLLTVLSTLGDLFATVEDIAKQNRQNLYLASGNLVKSTENVNQITSKFNKAFKQTSLNNSVSNIEASTAGLNKSSLEIQKITENFTTTSNSVNEIIPRIDSVLYQTQSAACNVNQITCGVKNTLKKRFGGFRLFFGKAIDSKKNGCCR